MKRIVACSDTHRSHWDVKVPEGDLFIFAGDNDITDLITLHDFNDWLGTINCKYKIVVGGNHDRYLEFIGKEESKRLLNNCIYLENEFIEVDGFKIFGSPYSCLFNDWSFMRPDNNLKEIWDTIPLETEILVTHTMPYGILDGVLPRMQSVGSLTLRDAIKRVQPKIQIGGHLHYYGGEKYYDGKTTYYNVSILNDEYEIEKEPTIIEI